MHSNNNNNNTQVPSIPTAIMNNNNNISKKKTLATAKPAATHGKPTRAKSELEKTPSTRAAFTAEQPAHSHMTHSHCAHCSLHTCTPSKPHLYVQGQVILLYGSVLMKEWLSAALPYPARLANIVRTRFPRAHVSIIRAIYVYNIWP